MKKLREPAPHDGGLIDTGASPGGVTGPVRVMRGEEEFGQLQPGEILVCPSMHSSWTLIFARVTALVTYHGGAPSRLSIVACEYGIPAVVGTGCATARLVTGQVVTVEGAAGQVDLAA